MPANTPAQLGEFGAALGASLNSELVSFVQQTAMQLEARLDDQVTVLGTSLNSTLLKLVETTAVHFQQKLDGVMKYTDEQLARRHSEGEAAQKTALPDLALSGVDGDASTADESPDSAVTRVPREWYKAVDVCLEEMDRRHKAETNSLAADNSKVWQALQALQCRFEQQLTQQLMELRQLLEQAEEGRRQLADESISATAADAARGACEDLLAERGLGLGQGSGHGLGERVDQLAAKLREGLSEEARGRADLAAAMGQDLREEKELRNTRYADLADKIAAQGRELHALAEKRAQEKQQREGAGADIDRKLKKLEDALNQERSKREQGEQAFSEQLAVCRRQITDEQMERTNMAIDLRRDLQTAELRPNQAIKDMRKDIDTESAKRTTMAERLDRRLQSIADMLSEEVAASKQAAAVARAAREEVGRRYQELSEALERERADREEGDAGTRAQAASRQDVGVERDARGQDVSSLRRELEELREELAAKAGELHGKFEAGGASRAQLTESAGQELRSLVDHHAAKLRTLSEDHEREAAARCSSQEDASHIIAELQRNIQEERVRREHGDASVRAELAIVRSDLQEEQSQRSDKDGELRSALRALESLLSQQLQEVRVEVEAAASRRALEHERHEGEERRRMGACEEGLREALARSRDTEASQASLRKVVEQLRSDGAAKRSGDSDELEALRRQLVEQVAKDLESERNDRNSEAAELRRNLEAMKYLAASQQQVEELRKELWKELRKGPVSDQLAKLDCSIAEMGQELVLFVEEQLRSRDADAAQLRRQQAVTDGVSKALRKDLGVLRTAVISKLHLEGLDNSLRGLEMPFGLGDSMASSLNKLQPPRTAAGGFTAQPPSPVVITKGPGAAAGAGGEFTSSPIPGALSIACLEAKLAALDFSSPNVDVTVPSDDSKRLADTKTVEAAPTPSRADAVESGAAFEVSRSVAPGVATELQGSPSEPSKAGGASPRGPLPAEATHSPPAPPDSAQSALEALAKRFNTTPSLSKTSTPRSARSSAQAPITLPPQPVQPQVPGSDQPSQQKTAQTMAELVSSVQKAFATSLQGTPRAGQPLSSSQSIGQKHGSGAAPALLAAQATLPSTSATSPASAACDVHSRTTAPSNERLVYSQHLLSAEAYAAQAPAANAVDGGWTRWW